MRLSIPWRILVVYLVLVIGYFYSALNSLADTCEGLYRCYIRFGGIYVYPSLELKEFILGKSVDQRT